MSEENKDIEPEENDVKQKIRELVVGGAMITVLYIFHEAKDHIHWGI